MGEYLIRTSRDNDAHFILWSTYSDCPVLVFEDIVEARKYLTSQYLHQNPQRSNEGFWFIPPFVDDVPGYSPENHGTPDWYLTRCHQWGNSASIACPAHWDGRGLQVMETAPKQPRDGTWILPREHFHAYAEALLSDDLEGANRFLEFQAWRDNE